MFSITNRRGRRSSSSRRATYRPKLEALEERSVPTTLVVTNTGDNGGVNPAPFAGTGTLRQAIIDADQQSSPAVIDFAIPTTDSGYNSTTGTFQIQPQAALPNVGPAVLDNNPVVIDGTSQPGYAGKPLIELNGADARAASGLRCDGGPRGGFDTIKGLDINSFSGFGIFLRSNDNTVTGCYIGTDVTGTQPMPNLGGGISVGDINSVYSSGNTIGGTAPGQGNVISGNGSTNYYSAPLGQSPAGVILIGPTNVVEGNLIGLTADGSAAVGTNVWPGVVVLAGNNTIGGLDTNVPGQPLAGAGNVISGSVDNTGIDISDAYQPLQGVVGVVIEGNYIGTNAAGTAAVGNGDGVYGGGSGTVIENNLISGNTRDGLTIGGLGTIVKDNYIGTDATGMAPLGNGSTGLYAGYSDMTIVGNVISANGHSGSGTNERDGIVLTTGSVPFAGTIVQGNYIGTDATGNPTLGMGNVGDGVLVSHGYGENITSNLIGGTTPGAANIIAGNGGSGVDMVGSGAFDNTTEGNSIYANGGLGIDLGDQGVPATNAANDAANHFGPNQLMNFPVLTSASFGATGTTVSGSLDTNTAGGPFPAGTHITLDFYANPAPAPNAHTQGQTWLGSYTLIADGTANVSFQATGLAAVPVGQDYLTATATSPPSGTDDTEGSTSEFTSTAVQVTTVTPIVTLTAANATYTGLPYATANLTTTITPAAASGSLSYVFYCDAAGQNQIPTPVNAGTYYLQAFFTSSSSGFTNAQSSIVSFSITPSALTVDANTQGTINISKAGTISFNLQIVAGLAGDNNNVVSLFNGATFTITVEGTSYDLTSTATANADGSIIVQMRMSQGLQNALLTALSEGNTVDFRLTALSNDGDYGISADAISRLIQEGKLTFAVV
jgi:hypothetical protein